MSLGVNFSFTSFRTLAAYSVFDRRYTGGREREGVEGELDILKSRGRCEYALTTHYRKPPAEQHHHYSVNPINL
jgi:hypothetical protein